MIREPDGARDHWPLHARQWALVGPPLRPDPEDVALVETTVAAWSASRARAPRAVLLGVTPELATMAWPAGTTLDAIDRSASMVDAIFPSTGTPARSTARVGEWLALPHATGSVDVVLGDGCLTCLAYPTDYRALAAELHRVVVDDGLVVLRVFAAPEMPETMADVAAALAAGRIASLHALKWRVAMALATLDRNVQVAAIWRAFEKIIPDRAVLAWPLEVVATIDVYRDSDVVYSFPTAGEIRAALGDRFVELRSHQHADRYPTLVLQPRPK